MIQIRKTAALLLSSFLYHGALVAQTSVLHIGPSSNSLVVSAGQPLTISGLTLTPSSTLSLSDNQITKGTTVTNPASLPYLPLVYRFTNPIASFAGTIAIEYTGTPIGTMNESNFKFHYHDAVRWKRDGASTVNTVTKVVTSSSLAATTLSEMTISDVAFALPAAWISFQAIRETDKVRLIWITASEQNTSFFEPQHSTDGSNWRALGRVPAAISSASERSYAFIHQEPVKGGLPNQYRILLRDQDGKESFTRIVTIRYDDGHTDHMLYPNPVREILSIIVPYPSEARMLNAAGAVVWKGRLNQGKNELSVAHLAAGMYILETSTDRHRIIIQR